MPKCIHGEVCRAYMRKGAHIISNYCPKQCKYFEPVKLCPTCRRKSNFCQKCGKEL